MGLNRQRPWQRRTQVSSTESFEAKGFRNKGFLGLVLSSAEPYLLQDGASWFSARRNPRITNPPEESQP